MRYASNHKATTRQNILRSASQLFAANGFEATSIDDIMRECKLTRGGFYSHFRSKSELYRQAMVELVAPAQQERQSMDSVLHSLLQAHDCAVRTETPLAFFATDATCDDPQVRAAYADALRTFSASIAKMANVDQATAALSTTAMIIGALVIARTIDDDALRIRLKGACADAAKSLLENTSQPQSFFWEAPDRNYAPSLAS
jgi:TetR/AcrR family transcriptional regulator, transcriptional repressor for nem operon